MHNRQANSRRLLRRVGILPLIMGVVLIVTLIGAARAQTFTTLYSFTGGADGAYPSGLLRDSAGNLYGTANGGGSPTCTPPYQGCGTVFKLDATGRLTVLYYFTGGTDGAYPAYGVIRDAVGNFYGTATAGGDLACTEGGGLGLGCGTVFKLDPAGNETVLHTFTGTPDGRAPSGGLVRDAQGNFYGVTGTGGVCSDRIGCGTVFKLDASGKETVLYAFSGGADGNDPVGLIRDTSGNLFGTTAIGGAFFAGTVFKVDTSGKLTTLHNFKGGADGQLPEAGLVAVGQHLYGTTITGGTNYGTIYKIDKTGKEAVIYNFQAWDGAYPKGTLVHDAVGNLYGTTFAGGDLFRGTVFELDTHGQQTVLYSFKDGTDGNTPLSGVIRDAAGNLYGTTQYGGAYGFGTIFKIAP